MNIKIKHLIKRFFDIDSIKQFYYPYDYNLKDIPAYSIAVGNPDKLLNSAT
jgi:hypothetical protein